MLTLLILLSSLYEFSFSYTYTPQSRIAGCIDYLVVYRQGKSMEFQMQIYCGRSIDLKEVTTATTVRKHTIQPSSSFSFLFSFLGMGGERGLGLGTCSPAMPPPKSQEGWTTIYAAGNTADDVNVGTRRGRYTGQATTPQFWMLDVEYLVTLALVSNVRSLALSSSH